MTLAVLVLLVALTSTVGTARANEITNAEKSLTFLKDVAGFNLDAYTVSLSSKEVSSNQAISKEVNDFTLLSDGSSCRAMCTFLNGKLQQVFMSNYSGLPKLSSSFTDTLAGAKAFMTSYSSLLSSPDYAIMRSSLDSVKLGENVTLVNGNVELTVYNVDQVATGYSWSFVDETGIAAPMKSVVLDYQNGLLKCFMDNWQLYSTTSETKIPKERAIEIALDAIGSYSVDILMPDNTTKSVDNYKVQSIGDVTLSYRNFKNIESARYNDPFTLYPTWLIPIGFNDVYYGDISGAHVRLWADTGEVCDISPIKSGSVNLEYTQPKDKELSQFNYQVLVVASLCCGTLCLLKWNGLSVKANADKRILNKLFSILLCFGLIVSTFSLAVSNVKANEISLTYGSYYYQISAEASAGYDATCYVTDLFSDAGYYVNNSEGSGTVRSTILNNADYCEDNYDFIAVFHFGHMYGANNYWDNNGDVVTHEDIYNHTGDGNHYFVFMWTCRQADDDTMANAWLHANNDWRSFIGFAGASPNLVTYSYTDIGSLEFCGTDVICSFYYNALVNGYSIGDSLEMMSYETIGVGFYYDLRSMFCGFLTYWPGNVPGGPGPSWQLGYMIPIDGMNRYLA